MKDVLQHFDFRQRRLRAQPDEFTMDCQILQQIWILHRMRCEQIRVIFMHGWQIDRLPGHTYTAGIEIVKTQILNLFEPRFERENNVSSYGLISLFGNSRVCRDCIYIQKTSRSVFYGVFKVL